MSQIPAGDPNQVDAVRAGTAKPRSLTGAVALGAAGAILSTAPVVPFAAALLDAVPGYLIIVAQVLIVPVAVVVALVGLSKTGARPLMSAGALIGIGSLVAASQLLSAWFSVRSSGVAVWYLIAAGAGALIVASGITAARTLHR